MTIIKTLIKNPPLKSRFSPFLDFRLRHLRQIRRASAAAHEDQASGGPFVEPRTGHGQSMLKRWVLTNEILGFCQENW